MNHSDYLQRQYELSVQAGTSQRYHQRCARFWWYFDFSAKVATGVFAIAALALAIVSLLTDSNAVDAWGVGVSLCAAIAAIVLNVAPFGSWEQAHRDLFRQWTDFREDVDGLEYDLGLNEPAPHQVCALSRLDAKSHRICGQEVRPNGKLVEECYQAETRSRKWAA